MKLFKNRKKNLFLLATVLVFLMVACSKKNVDLANIPGDTVPETSSQEMLANGLEYLLVDNPDEEAFEETEATEETAVTDVTEATGEIVVTDIAETTDASNNEVAAVIYHSKGNIDELEREEVYLDEMNPEELLKRLSGYNIVSIDTQVLAFEEEKIEGKTVLTLDLSRQFAEYLRTMSEEAEYIIMASLVDTFLENYKASAFRITIEGDACVTSNRSYEGYMEKCVPADFVKEVKEAE